MPSEKILQQKKETVTTLTNKLKGSVAGVLVDYKGINVTDDTKLRRELREAGVEYSVIKNSLLRFASKQVGFDSLESVLEGTTALALSESDQVAAAKILTKYAEGSKGKFVVKAGFVDGGVIDAAKVSELGNLPSRDGLLSMLCSALQGNIRGLAVALNAVAEKAPADPVAPTAEAAPVADAVVEAPAADVSVEVAAEIAAPIEEAPEAPKKKAAVKKDDDEEAPKKKTPAKKADTADGDEAPKKKAAAKKADTADGDEAPKKKTPAKKKAPTSEETPAE